jgi:hypothetical protein
LAASHLASTQRHWLTPDRTTKFVLPELQTETLGGAARIACGGPENGPLILYFHGWGDDYQMVMPLEWGLAEWIANVYTTSLGSKSDGCRPLPRPYCRASQVGHLVRLASWPKLSESQVQHGKLA